MADYWSKVIDYDDWMVHPAVFAHLNQMWGTHTVDRFANGWNRQVSRFNSRFYEPDTEAVDAFTCDWQGEVNWWCPPVDLIPRVIQHAQKTKAKGMLIVPEWPSAPFWPILFPGNGDTAEYVVEICQLPRADWLLIPGRLGSNLFSGVPNTNVLAVYLDFELEDTKQEGQERCCGLGQEEREEENCLNPAGLEDYDAGQAWRADQGMGSVCY